MIYKVEVTNKMIPRMTLSHQFETILDTEEEAKDFGDITAKIVFAFNAGFSEADTSQYHD